MYCPNTCAAVTCYNPFRESTSEVMKAGANIWESVRYLRPKRPNGMVRSLPTRPPHSPDSRRELVTARIY
eukprot:1305947-Pyramimonas_sp.AAC.1